MSLFSSRNILIIDRYLIRRYLVPFAYCVAAFLLVMVIYDFSINLEDFIDGKVRLDIILEYFIYSVPAKLTDIFPMASLLSLLYSLGQLKKHNEITAFQASGVSPLRLMVPFICLGIVTSFFVLAWNDLLVTRCQQRVAKIEAVYMKKGDTAKVGAAPSVFAFYNLRENRSWVGVLDPSKKKLQRVEIREFDQAERVIKKIAADQAAWAPGEWKLTSGKVTEYTEGVTLGLEQKAAQSPDSSTSRRFKEELFTFPETLKDLLDSQKETQFMTLRELGKHIQIHPKHSRILHEERVDYHHKLAYPFLNLLVILMGVPIGLKSGKGHFLLGISTCLGLFVAYYGVNLVSLTLGKNEVIAAWLGAWLPTMLFAVVGMVLMRRTR